MMGRMQTRIRVIPKTLKMVPTCSVRHRTSQSLSRGNALAPNRRNSLPCTVRISRQRSCNQRVGCLQCTVPRVWGEGPRVWPWVDKLTVQSKCNSPTRHEHIHLYWRASRGMGHSRKCFIIVIRYGTIMLLMSYGWVAPGLNSQLVNSRPDSWSFTSYPWYSTLQTTNSLWCTTFVWEVLTVHGNELRLFWAKAFPPL